MLYNKSMLKPGQVVKKFKSKKGNEILIRLAKPSDAIAIDRMNEADLQEKHPRKRNDKNSLGEVRKWLKEILRKMSKNDSLLIYAFSKDKTVGECSIERDVGPRDHIGKLGISVIHDYRKEGIGYELVSQALNLAKESLKMEKVILGVRKPNKPALNLYKKIGFKKYGELPGGYKISGNYFDRALMYKEI